MFFCFVLEYTANSGLQKKDSLIGALHNTNEVRKIFHLSHNCTSLNLTVCFLDKCLESLFSSLTGIAFYK